MPCPEAPETLHALRRHADVDATCLASSSASCVHGRDSDDNNAGAVLLSVLAAVVHWKGSTECDISCTHWQHAWPPRTGGRVDVVFLSILAFEWHLRTTRCSGPPRARHRTCTTFDFITSAECSLQGKSLRRRICALAPEYQTTQPSCSGG